MLNIIPKPTSATAKPISLSLTKSTKLCGEFQKNFKVIAGLLPSANGSENSITFIKDQNIASEGYKIEAVGEDINVYSADSAGAFYAVCTLLQLEQGGKVNAVSVTDAPRFSHRGFMLDCSRHFWSVSKIKQVLDFMASVKLNTFHWHLSDDQGWRVEIKKYPLLTEAGSIRKSTALWRTNHNECNAPFDPNEYGRGCYYTQDEVREIVAYAKERHITVIPEIDMPGHLTAAIAAYPFLSCTEEQIEVGDYWGILYNIACAGKEEVYSFIEDILDELCSLFPAEYFHLGGDEVPKKAWQCCDKCKKLMQEQGMESFEELQGYFNERVVAMLAKRGKKAIGWNEVLETGRYKPDILPQWWILEGNKQKELEHVNNGGKVILSPTTYFYFDFPHAELTLERVYSFDIDKMGIEDEGLVVGIEAPLWCEYIRGNKKFDLNAYARLLALAEICWSDRNRDYSTFEERVEALRPYFKNKGISLAPQKIYKGHTVPKGIRGNLEEVHKIWWQLPNFEMDVLDD